MSNISAMHSKPKKIKLDLSDRIIRGVTYVIISIFSV